MSRLTKKATMEKTFERLKILHADYTRQVTELIAERDAIIEALNYASDLADQTADAINALEGKPTLKKMLEEALAQKMNSPTIPVPDLGTLVPDSYTPKGMLPAEPGMKWIKNGDEYLLVPIAEWSSALASAGATITVPPVEEDATFEAPTLDI
jgi:hypothetical protein